MRKYITSDINATAHSIQSKLDCTWEFAFNLAVYYGPESIHSFVSTQWHSDDARALADHFWALHKAYEEVRDRGRSITMSKAAKSIYNAIDTCGTCNLSVLNSPGIGKSVVREAFDFHVAGSSAELTPRSRKIILSGHALGYAHRAKVPLWLSHSPNRKNHTSIH